MCRIKKASWLLAIICLVSCSNSAVLEFFQEPETAKVDFKVGAVNKAAEFNLSRLRNVTIALLPVRSSVGGGLGEEVVTKYFYENIAKKFNNIKFISAAQASDLFTDVDLWEDYFAYLEKYHQAAVADKNFDELRGLYQKLGAGYIININSDYPIIPKYPGVFETNIQVQIWDINSGKKIWEGFGRGRDMIFSADDVESVKQKLVDWVCRRMAEEMAGGTTQSQ